MNPPLGEEELAWFRSTFHDVPKPQLPDDSVEYSLHWFANDAAAEDEDAVRRHLFEVQKTSTELLKDLLKDYIWQRDPFKLEFAREGGSVVLRGVTGFGDSIEDEWLVVYILRELTRKFNDLWVKISDQDGEFLLVEAADMLPSWIEPDVASNRVWINRGRLIILKPASVEKETEEKLTLQDAKDIILHQSDRLMHSQNIEQEAFFRLRHYPQQIANNMHTARIRVPRKVAFLLHLKPAYISPAVEAFYLRDPIALRPLQTTDPKHLVFPPEDFVTMSARFPKVGYAQLKGQDIETPKAWSFKMLPASAPPNEHASADMGMKVTCGLEMLLSDAQYRDKPAAREIKIVLEDLASGDEQLPTNKEIDEQWEKREDDEKWLEVSMEDLESELKGKKGEGGSNVTGDFGDRAAQENLRRMVARFQDIINDDPEGFFSDSSEDEPGDEQESDDDEAHDHLNATQDGEESFDEEELKRMMEQIMEFGSTG